MRHTLNLDDRPRAAILRALALAETADPDDGAALDWLRDAIANHTAASLTETRWDALRARARRTAATRPERPTRRVR